MDGVRHSRRRSAACTGWVEPRAAGLSASDLEAGATSRVPSSRAPQPLGDSLPPMTLPRASRSAGPRRRSIARSHLTGRAQVALALPRA